MKAKTGLILAVFAALAVGAGTYLFGISGDHSVGSGTGSSTDSSGEQAQQSAAGDPDGVAADSGNSVTPADSVDVLAERLKLRLEKEPNDMNGWLLLSQSYHFLGRQEDALAAFEKAKALGYTGDEPKIPHDSMSANHSTSSSSGQENWLASYISSNVAATKDENQSATGEVSPVLTVDVAVEKEIAEKFPKDTAVYIFARTESRGGPPLAVVRKQLSDLPLRLQLDDSSAMVPGQGISSASSVVLCARISPSGNPMKQDGDVEVLSKPTPVIQKEPVLLTLSVENQADAG